MNTSKNADRRDGGCTAQKVYVKDEVEGWVVGVVVENSKSEVRCRLLNGEERIVKLKEYKKSELPKESTKIANDLLNMDYVHEPGVLFNLVRRRECGKPYTRAGDLLISVNPFKWTDGLYSEEKRKFYAQKLVWQVSGDDPRKCLEPHIYEVSAMAYVGLAFQGQNQSVLITGESGSGKTEAAKLMMHHIAAIQVGPTNTDESDRKLVSSDFTCSPDLFSEIVERILRTNPILEAFGNAATSQNDNSSRFGKYTQLQFKNSDSTLISYNVRSKALCTLVGSVCDVYLLEASRVCMHAFDERNYHIFYQLLSTDDEMKSRIWTGLVGRTATDFKYVGTSTMAAIGGVHDAVKFQETWLALGRLAVPEIITIRLLRAICLVMQLGNLEFTVNSSSDDKAHLKEDDNISYVSDLLGVSKGDLLMSFTERTMTTRGEVFKVPLSVSAASEARDSLAKEIYIRSFFWLADAMNSKTRADSPSDNDYGVIGILDIFGFESFKTNRFEQLCINYANEKLHQKAINDIFVSVREEYSYEGIPLDLVDFSSNQQVLDFIEGRTGLIALLNEESYRPKGSSKAFTTKVFEKFNAVPHIVKPPAGVTNMFGVAHFAGTVMYTTDNFVMGNQDTLPHDLKVCVSKSSNPVVSGSLFNETKDLGQDQILRTSNPISSNVVHLTGSKNSFLHEIVKPLHGSQQENAFFDDVKREKNVSKMLIASTDKLDHISFRPREQPRHKRTESDIVAPTVGTKYRRQLSSLLRKLGDTTSRYVRCIKPNQLKNPNECSLLMMTEQIRCAGIVPAIILSKSLFSKSISNKVISVKYRVLWKKALYPSRVKRMDRKETRQRMEAEAILASIFSASNKDQTTSEQKDLYFVGKTKTFFRQGVYESLEKKHSNVLQACATSIQRFVRGNIEQKKFLQKLQSAKTIKTWCQKILKIRKAKRNIFLINKFLAQWKRFTQLKKNERKSATKIQNFYRAYVVQSWYSEANKNKKSKNAAIKKIQSFFRTYHLLTYFDPELHAIVIIQCWIRKKQARKSFSSFGKSFASQQKYIDMAVKIQKLVRKFLKRVSEIKWENEVYHASKKITAFLQKHTAIKKFKKQMILLGFKVTLSLEKI